MSSTQKQITEAITEARPKLKDISPLVAKIVLGFGFGNLLLGGALVSTQAYVQDGVVIAPNSLLLQIWGGVFIALGISMLYCYHRNHWKALRQIFVIAILIKFLWAIALVIRYIQGDYSNPFLLIIWLIFAYIQAVTYIHFLPSTYLEKAANDADV